MAEKAIPVSKIEARIRAIDLKIKEISKLQAEREMLLGLLENGNVVEFNTRSSPPEAMGAREALRFVLLTHGPCVPSYLISKAAAIVRSAATDVPQTLSSTISYLKRRGEIEVTDGGGLRWNERGDASGN